MQAGQRSRIAVALGAAAALAAGLAACGPRAEDQPLQLKGGVPVGAVLSLTSNANAYGQDQQIGLKLAQAWFQQRRNANSQKALELNLRLEDGGGDEATASQAFNLLIDAGVVALIGPTLSQQAFAADPIAQRRGVPVVAPSNTATGIPQIGSFISRVSAPSTEIAPLSIAKALQLTPSIKRAAVFYAHDDAYSTSETVIFQKALTDKGLKPVTVQRTQLNDQDFQNQITSALRESPDLIVISAQAVDGGNLIRQLRELGYRGAIVVGNGMNTPNIYPICQRYCDGILIAQAYSPELDTPVNREFVALYQKAKGGAIPPQLTAQAFTAYQVVAEALQRLNKRQPLAQLSLGEARKALMAELLGGQYDTPLGEISFTSDGEVVQQRFHVAQVQMQPDGRSGRFLLLP
ncbi:ABC transporter substrate-binding protein [Synechococcus sp. 1G10]|uniref:ABC transporter substrate-binding protein n=1 Tax=Synechococcus sp. 1G10 TaxID=2025605 RepID=UPI000B99649C|nr:ABC transporter substrate-binding protein [Synechococcus sp. 1G10]